MGDTISCCDEESIVERKTPRDVLGLSIIFVPDPASIRGEGDREGEGDGGRD